MKLGKIILQLSDKIQFGCVEKFNLSNFEFCIFKLE